MAMRFSLLFTGVCLWFVFSGMTSSNPNSYDNRLEVGIDAFYRSDWKTAQTIFKELQVVNKDNPKAYFFESMIPFWQYFFGASDAKVAAQFLKSSEKAIDVAERRLKKQSRDTSTVLMLSGLYGYRSLVAASEKEYTTAIKSGVTGFSYTRQLLAMNDSNEDALIGKGVFQYMMGSVPKEGRWMTGMMGMSGDIETGFRELERASESKSKSSTDARMILVYLYDREKRHDDALRVAQLLVESYPENIIFQYFLARSLDMSSKHDKAADVYRKVVDMKSDLSGLKTASNERLRELSR